MKEHSSKLLAKALDTIEGAEGLLNMGKEEIAAGRAYYAMFYVAEALLFEIGLQFSQHGQVIAAYENTSRKPKTSTRNFIAGSEADSTPAFLAIMMLMLKSAGNLRQS